jgi:hypothetical protein
MCRDDDDEDDNDDDDDDDNDVEVGKSNTTLCFLLLPSYHSSKVTFFFTEVNGDMFDKHGISMLSNQWLQNKI